MQWQVNLLWSLAISFATAAIWVYRQRGWGTDLTFDLDLPRKVGVAFVIAFAIVMFAGFLMPYWMSLPVDAAIFPIPAGR